MFEWTIKESGSFFNVSEFALLTPPNCEQISTNSFLHPTRNFKTQCIALSDFQISTGVPVKKPVSRSYPKIIGFWTSSGRILPKLCQSDVQTHVYWCLKYDTLWWLIWGHITKCYNSACGWVKALIDTSKWSQLNAASVKRQMTPFRWPLHVLRKGHYLQLYTGLRPVSKLKMLRVKPSSP